MSADFSGLFNRPREDAIARVRAEAGVTAAVASIAAVLTAAMFIRGPADFTRISDLRLAWVAGALVIAAIIALLIATIQAIRAGGKAKAELIDAVHTNQVDAVTAAGGLIQKAHKSAAAAVVLFVIAASMTWIWSDEVVIQTQDGGTAGDVHTFCGRLMTSSNTGVAFVRTKDGQVHAIKIAEIKSNSNATCP